MHIYTKIKSNIATYHGMAYIEIVNIAMHVAIICTIYVSTQKQRLYRGQV